MKSQIVFHIFSGTMLSGKTQIINKIIELNNESERSNSNTVKFFVEDNFYLEKNLKAIESNKVINKHFLVQKILLKNFQLKLNKTIMDLISLKKKDKLYKYDLVFDTFPFISGMIYTTDKKNNGLISAAEYSILRSEYIVLMDKFQKSLFELDKLQIELIYNNYIRVTDHDLMLKLLKGRSQTEFDFYSSRINYFNEVNKHLGDVESYKKKFDNIINYNIINCKKREFYINNIQNMNHFSEANELVLKTFYGG